MVGRLLGDIPTERLSALLKAEGVSEADAKNATARIVETAALCRLAFAALVDIESDWPIASGVPDGSVISQTRVGLARGCPTIARWAFWAAYLIQKQFSIGGRRLTSPLLAKVVEIFLARSTLRPGDVRTRFTELRKEAARNATAASERLQGSALKQGVDDRSFEQEYRSRYEEDLPPNTVLPGISNGRLTNDWLSALLQVRREILAAVSTHGPLAGSPPFVGVSTRTVIVREYPLMPSRTIGGRLHLGKDLNVRNPNPPTRGGITSLEFPRSMFDDEPYAATLYAVPVWWFKWAELFVARPEPVNGSKSHSRAAAEVGDFRACSWRFV